MRKIGNLFLPDDAGYDPNQHKQYSWNKIRNLAGMPQVEGANIQILGFYVLDGRTNPPIARCKNCEFPVISDVEAKKTGYKRPVMKEPPKFFSYAGEAASFIKSMNLSFEDDRKMKIVALAPAPESLGDPMPTHIFMDKDALKER